MEREVARLEEGAQCCGWNYCGRRLAVGFADGTVAVLDSGDPFSCSENFRQSHRWRAHENSVTDVIWIPPIYGDAVACICVDGTVSLWEEIGEDSQSATWKLCKLFKSSSSSHALNLQFGVSFTSLKLVTAYSDGYIKVSELMDPLELSKWQLQAEFQNVIDMVTQFGKPSCVSACIAWNPQRGEHQRPSFILGFNSDLPQFNSCKIWEFEEAHQRWLPVAELALPEEKGDCVFAVAWAPNIGRPYELIAVATSKGISMWHVGLRIESDGRLSTEKIALLPGHDGEVWQLEWDIGGMSFASTGGDGMVRLWQSDLNGVWREQATLDCSAAQQ